MARVLLGGQIGLKYQAYPHGIPSILSDIDRGLEGVLELELAGLNGDDLHDGQLRH